MKSIKIGVLGGIGPEATGTFYLKLIERLQKEKIIDSNEDFPQIVVNSIPAPELVFDKINDDDLEPYIKGLKELDSMDLDFIVMVCNTIHLFYDKLQPAIKTEIIDLREEVLNTLKNSNQNKVTVVGTPSTISLGLYEFPGIEYHNPSKEELRSMSESIFLFNKGIDKERQVKKTLKVVNKHLTEGSQVVLLACTEFAVMLNNVDVPKMNTIDILVEAVVKKFKQKRKFV
jgi:aspartate racemase